MARPLRLQGEGLTYHVVARGSGRMVIYRDDVDYRRFLALLATLVRELSLRCHAYCLMPNHYHLLLTTERANLSAALRQLNGIYAQQWNVRHDRVGHVFQGRFRAQIVQDGAYFLTVCRYIARNPVRARIVTSPELWPWSSYGATAGLVPPPRFLHRDAVLSYYGEASAASERYRAFVIEDSTAPERLPTGPLLGDNAFVRGCAVAIREVSDEVPRAQRPAPPSLSELFGGAHTRAMRQAAMVVAHQAGYTRGQIAAHLDVHYATVSRAVAAVGEGSGRANCRIARPDPF